MLLGWWISVHVAVADYASQIRFCYRLTRVRSPANPRAGTAGVESPTTGLDDGSWLCTPFKWPKRFPFPSSPRC